MDCKKKKAGPPYNDGVIDLSGIVCETEQISEDMITSMSQENRTKKEHSLWTSQQQVRNTSLRNM